ncbi:MAG: hypothetical protein ABH844_07685 [Candidatus Omnitrophota bacterium]
MGNFVNRLFFILLLVFSSGVSCAAEPVEITAKVDREEINVGDRVTLSVRVVNSAGYDMLFPEAPDNAGEFTFIESRPIKAGWRKNGVFGREYVFTIYDTGTRVIPPIEVQYKSLNQDKWLVQKSPRVQIEVKSLLTDKDTDIRDIKGLAVFGMSRVRLVIIIFALMSIVVAGWMSWRNVIKQKTLNGDVIKKSAYEIAYEELDVLKKKDLPGKNLIKEYYVGLSTIVRRYIENRFYLRAPEMTTEEFLIVVKGSSKMAREHKGLLREFLSHCDMVKFAKYGPSHLEIIDSLRSVERFLDQTRPIEQEETEKE